MKPRRLIGTVLAIGLGAATLAVVLGPTGVGAQPSPSGQLNCTVPGQRETPNPPLVLTVTTDQPAYPVGTPVTFTLAVTNPSPAPVTVGVGAMVRDFAVRDAGGAEIWRWTHGKVFTRILLLCTLAPGETAVLAEQWDQRDNEGRQVPPGGYSVVAELATPGQRPAASPAQFTITQTPPTSTPAQPAGRGEQILLYPGCNNVSSTWPDGTPTPTVAGATTPPGVVVAAWRYDAQQGRFLGFSPQFSQASDLMTVNRLDAIFICVRESASLLRPVI